MIPLLVLFGWRTIFRLGQVKPTWGNNYLRSGCGSSLMYRCSIIMDIMEVSWQKYFKKTARKVVNLKVFLVLEHRIRKLVQIVQFSPSCTWHTPLWYIYTFIGIITVVIMHRCGLFTSDILTGSKVDYLTTDLVLLRCNFIMTCYVWMSGDVWIILIIIDCKIIRNFQSGIDDHESEIPWFFIKHSSLVTKFCHSKTGYLSPQYHVVFDHLF